MNRYKFRGKPVGEDIAEMFESANEFYKDGYVYGYLVAENIIAYGVVETHDSAIVYEYWAKVDPATIGQYTGLKDKNGKEVYEGDIVHYVYEPGEGFWNANQYAEILSTPVGLMFGRVTKNKYAKMMGYLSSIPHNNGKCFEVIGNVLDNPELLEG